MKCHKDVNVKHGQAKSLRVIQCNYVLRQREVTTKRRKGDASPSMMGKKNRTKQKKKQRGKQEGTNRKQRRRGRAKEIYGLGIIRWVSHRCPMLAGGNERKVYWSQVSKIFKRYSHLK